MFRATLCSSSGESTVSVHPLVYVCHSVSVTVSCAGRKVPFWPLFNLIHWVPKAVCPGLKRSERETNHSPPTLGMSGAISPHPI